jgi:hypothetical protein
MPKKRNGAERDVRTQCENHVREMKYRAGLLNIASTPDVNSARAQLLKKQNPKLYEYLYGKEKP